MMARTEEDREETRQFRDLKKQLTAERRENAALRKKIIQLESSLDMVGEEPDLEDETPKKKAKGAIESCPKCGSYNLEIFTLGIRPYYRCLCGGKGQLKPTVS